MRIRVQVVIEGNEDVPPEVHEVADLQRGDHCDPGCRPDGERRASFDRERETLRKDPEWIVRTRISVCRSRSRVTPRGKETPVGINVSILAGTDTGNSSVNAWGSVQDIISDTERNTFGLQDANLKNAVGKY